MWTAASPSEIRSYYLRSLLPNSKQNLRMRVKMCFLGGRWSGTHSTTSFSFSFFPSLSGKNEEENRSCYFLVFHYLTPYKSVPCRAITWSQPRWKEWPPAHRKVNRAALPQIFGLCSLADAELNWCNTWSNGNERVRLGGTRDCSFE